MSNEKPDKEKPAIKLPTKLELSEGGEGSYKLEALTKKEASERFREINTLLYAVVIATLIIVISALISVTAIIIDQLHFNNLTYREFSGLNKGNDELLKRITVAENRIDNANQQIIIEQQKQVISQFEKNQEDSQKRIAVLETKFNSSQDNQAKNK